MTENVSSQGLAIANAQAEYDNSKKSVGFAYVLLILVGTLGVHNFYLGRVGAGVTQLLLTLVGWLTVVFIVGFVPLGLVLLWLIVELFTLPGTVRLINEEAWRKTRLRNGL